MLRKFFKKKLVSIVISNKNSLRLLKGTIESLKNQTYKNIEVIVIDGKSNDGSLEFLNSQKKFLNLKIISEKDSGISEAYSKGLKLASGEIVGMLAADERYYPHTIKQIVKWFSKYPDNIVCGGSCKFLNQEEKEIDEYVDDYLGLERHLTCEHICAILPSFFNKKILGEDLFFKTSQKTCPDYDLWARLALKYPLEKFKWFKLPIAKALRTDDSMSFRATGFEQMVNDKISYLEDFLSENNSNERIKNISFDRCAAGIHMWAAEQIIYIDYNHDAILNHCNAAYSLDNQYNRILKFIDNNDFFIEKVQGKSQISRYHKPQNSLQTISESYQVEMLADAEKLATNPLKIKTTNSAWGYAAIISFDDDLKAMISKNSGSNYWVSFLIYVEAGSIGIGKRKNQDIVSEKIVKKGEEKTLYFKLHETSFNYDFLIRSGGEANSVTIIKNIKLCCEQD